MAKFFVMGVLALSLAACNTTGSDANKKVTKASTGQTQSDTSADHAGGGSSGGGGGSC